jgi:hypothetical protein
MDLEEIFDDVSAQMKRDFTRAQKALSHPGQKGDANEETVRSFLKQYLPKVLDVSTGILVDSLGNRSNQLDIILSDAAKTPIFYQSGNLRVIPVECAYAVIEVKAFLSKEELRKAYENMVSVKRLVKKAYFNEAGVIKHTHDLYSEKWDYFPLMHFIFAFDSPDIQNVKDNLNELQSSEPPHNRVDMVCVLEKGVIANKWEDGNYYVLPNKNSELVAGFSDKPLISFYTLISVVLNQVKMSHFNILPYIKNAKL